jgi:hypothetical protein
MEPALSFKSPFVLTDQEIEERLGETLDSIAVLKQDYGVLKVSGVDDEDGYKAVHSAKMDIVHRRNNIKKNGLASRKDANDFCTSVLRIEKRLNKEIEPIETHLDTQEKIVTDEKARIKAEAEAKEAARIQVRIDHLHAMGCTFNGQNYVLPFAPAGYACPQALMKSCNDEQFEQISKSFYALVEIEHARIEAEKAAKIEEENRIAKIRAEQEAEAKRLTEIKAEQDKKAAEIKAAQDAVEAEKKRIADEQKRVADEKRRKEELEKAKIEAAEKAKRETEARLKREAEQREEELRLAKLAEEKALALRPDKEKANTYFQSLNGYMQKECPLISDRLVQKIIVDFENVIEKAIDDSINKVEAL